MDMTRSSAFLWIAGIAARGWAFPGWTSVAVHTLPPTCAYLALRGRGLLQGIEVGPGAGEVVARCRQNGLLVNLAGEHTVRFAPAYITTREQLAEGLAIFERSL